MGKNKKKSPRFQAQQSGSSTESSSAAEQTRSQSQPGPSGVRQQGPGPSQPRQPPQAGAAAAAASTPSPTSPVSLPPQNVWAARAAQAAPAAPFQQQQQQQQQQQPQQPQQPPQGYKPQQQPSGLDTMRQMGKHLPDAAGDRPAGRAGRGAIVATEAMEGVATGRGRGRGGKGRGRGRGEITERPGSTAAVVGPQPGGPGAPYQAPGGLSGQYQAPGGPGGQYQAPGGPGGQYQAPGRPSAQYQDPNEKYRTPSTQYPPAIKSPTRELRRPQQPSGPAGDATVAATAAAAAAAAAATSPTSTGSEPYKIGPPVLPPNIYETVSKIPKRKDINKAGTAGKKIVVKTNHLPLLVSKLKSKTAIHYDVCIEPDRPKRLLRFAMEEFRVRFYPRRYPSFDGRKNLYAASELNVLSGNVTVVDPETRQEKEFTIVMKRAATVDLSVLEDYMRRGTSLEAPQTAIQVLDIILRSAPALKFVPVGRSYFTPPRDIGEASLGHGFEVWHGLFQSVVLGSSPYVNVDVVHKGFPSAKSLLEVIKEICGGEGRYAKPVNLNQELDRYQCNDLQKFIKGLKIDYKLPDIPTSRRTYKVNAVQEPAYKRSFQLSDNTKLTVDEYFAKHKGIKLRYPHLPCLHVGALNRPNPIYVPVEFCSVTRGQVTQRKLNENQTTNMIRQAATDTTVRERKIMEALNEVNFNASPHLQEFGVVVGDKFTVVDARIIDPPYLTYKDKRTTPLKGVWRPESFYNGAPLANWTIIKVDVYANEDAVRAFIDLFIRNGQRCGMEICPPQENLMVNLSIKKGKRDLEAHLQKCKGLDIVIVVVPDRGDVYSVVKQLAELSVGVLTQCLKNTTLLRKMNASTAINILLKVNSKLNGTNHIMTEKPACLKRYPCMIIGADVTHPSPDQTQSKSVAAVCASHDLHGYKYNVQFCFQEARKEIISDLHILIKNHLMFYYQQTKQKPAALFFFRDGVSEGQFGQVLHYELGAIRRACREIQKDGEYKPRITFLVVQKRHHTRFFPNPPDKGDGKNKNVLPGTIVDTTITHPTEIEFYLVSHASIQGVSRPTKYHCLWDENRLTEDEMEQLTYFLCHMFSRCTRSVSYPTPTYYAHLAAYRARVYMEGETYSSDKIKDLQAKSTFLPLSPMYFV